MQRSHVPAERESLPGGATLIRLKGLESGPTLALLGGVHGDEDEGVLAVHRVVHEVARLGLAGELRAVAPASPTAWATQSRTSPLDDANLARSFPGDHDGGPTAMLAAGIAEQVIDGADLLIDLHSAGVRYAMPLFCGFSLDTAARKDSQRVAEAFGTPLIWAHPSHSPGRSLSVAYERGIAAIYAECSGAGSIHHDELDAYVRGVLSVMAEFAMLTHPVDRLHDEPVQWMYGDGDTDAGAQAYRDGWFVSSTHAGTVVTAGTEIGRLFDYQGHQHDVIRAPRDGIVAFLRRQARILVGDVLYVLAELRDGAP